MKYMKGKRGGVSRQVSVSMCPIYAHPPHNAVHPALQMSEMRQLLFGKAGGSNQLTWPAWKQGFFFCSRPGLSFGLVQQQGGPCGLLAAVQVWAHLFV